MIFRTSLTIPSSRRTRKRREIFSRRSSRSMSIPMIRLLIGSYSLTSELRSYNTLRFQWPGWPVGRYPHLSYYGGPCSRQVSAPIPGAIYLSTTRAAQGSGEHPRVYILFSTASMYIPVPPHRIGSFLFPDCFISSEEIMLVFEYVIFISRIADIDQMVRNRFSIYCIVGQVLSCPDIH